MSARQSEIHKVDIDKAQAAMEYMSDYVSQHSEEVSKAEALAKESLMGLILTAVSTGLIPNATKETTEFRNKIFMAFDFGYFYGKLGAGEK